MTVATERVSRYEAAAHPASDGLSGTVVMGALVSALMGAFAGALWQMKRDYSALDRCCAIRLAKNNRDFLDSNRARRASLLRI